MNDDFIMDASCWHVEAEAPAHKARALAHFRDRYLVLLEFLRGESLLRSPDFGRNVRNWSDFEIRKSDLTQEGFELFACCHRDWNPGIREARTKRHLAPWKARLTEMRGAA